MDIRFLKMITLILSIKEVLEQPLTALQEVTICQVLG